MTCQVTLVLASECEKTGQRIWTFQLRYWRAIHAELMTHRVFSRNAGSSRAKPVKKVLAQVWNDPAGPEHWGANQAGMQAKGEVSGWRRAVARALWRGAGKVACVFAWSMMRLGLHKQVANRILEPWQYIDVLVTATAWDNFFHLRDHPDAQPEFQTLARAIKVEMDLAVGGGRVQRLKPGQWHLPYVELKVGEAITLADALKASTARSARVSYEPFDGNGMLSKEIERHDKLVASDPIHASPTEHQARCMGESYSCANFTGWRQYRWYIENRQPVPE